MFGGTFGMQEIALIMLLILVLFGAKRIPEMMKGFGQGLGEFKAACNNWNSEIEDVVEEANK